MLYRKNLPGRGLDTSPDCGYSTEGTLPVELRGCLRYREISHRLNRLTAALFLLALTASPAMSNAVSVPAPECSAVFRTDAHGQHIEAVGYASVASPGDPALPFRDLLIVLPPDADPASVSASLAGSTVAVLDGPRDIAPAPPILTSGEHTGACDWGAGKRIEQGRNVLVYGSARSFPPDHVELIEVGSLGGRCVARVRYYPYRWNPATRELRLATGGQLILSFRPSRHAAAQQPARGGVLDHLVERLAANWAEARDWYAAPAHGPLLRASVEEDDAGYLILTTGAIASGSAKLQDFVRHKTDCGFAVSVVTEAAWGGGTGNTAADRIRSYLKANYLTRGIRYVLLIGNPNPSTGDVPMKMLWPRRNADTYKEAPSDYFYADLTGNWDLDGDGYFGEQNDDFGTGGIDRFPEVIVGRIPFYGSFADLDTILQKIIDYESAPGDRAWVRSVLLSMKPSDGSTPGYHLGQAIANNLATPAGFETLRVYQESYGLSPPPDHVPCAYDTVLSAWQQHPGVHVWWTHGSTTTAADVHTSDRCRLLDDSFPTFTFQSSCLNGQPEAADNLGYSLLKRGAIATDSATRVSWYIPGQTSFSSSDSNAGLAYKYASKLIADHLPCGDAHYSTMVEVPNAIWMNHCVFNLYGDPSVAYVAGHSVTHTPLPDTDNTSVPYYVQADVTPSGVSAAGSPSLHWSADGGATFNVSPMVAVAGTTYRAQIPPQPHWTRVHYYIHAQDAGGRTATSPHQAPMLFHTFLVRPDSTAPAIEHTPRPDTGSRTGPYRIQALVTDDHGVASVTLNYSVNSGPETHTPMLWQGPDIYEAQIPGPRSVGDVISYWITAADSSSAANVAREPEGDGRHSFQITPKISVGIYNSRSVPSYFIGGSTNAYEQVALVLDSDPWRRFETTVLTSLDKASLAPQDALVLPDNAVLESDLQSVADWFAAGKTILCLDNAACYAAYSGLMWPTSGVNGYGTYWDSFSSADGQQIWLADPVTRDYAVGQVIESRPNGAQLYVDRLPADAKALSCGMSDPTRCYAAYRDVPGRGRIGVLGPYIPVAPGHYSIIREILTSPSEKLLRLVSPNGNERFEAGDTVHVAFQARGLAEPDRIRLEYATGLDGIWRPVPGAESVAPSQGTAAWTTVGLPGSRRYRVRAALAGGAVYDESDWVFSIIPSVGILQAKATPDGQVVKLPGKVVTSGLTNLSYVQEPNGLAGIRVLSDAPLSPGDCVTLIGTMSTIDGERALVVEEIQPAVMAAPIKPWAITTSALGGARCGLQEPTMGYRLVREGYSFARQFGPAQGLNNVGLFVRVTGRVTSAGLDHFCIDDGGGGTDPSGSPGVRVICPGIPKPLPGQHVTVDAISSTYLDHGSLYKALVLPRRENLRVLPLD